MSELDTIAAVATAAGKGGVGIIRVSGPQSLTVAKQLVHKATLKPRFAYYLPFYDTNNTILDEGITLYFQGPKSYTGEDVVEFQGHGGPIVLDLILQQILMIPNVRMARPGEFTERAYLNDRIDLAQAEAIADLIDSTTTQAAKAAVNSLQGEFSKHIYQLVEQIIQLRLYVEAAIDFPEEEVDFLADQQIHDQLHACQQQLHKINQQAQQGSLLQEGMTLVIAGKPNAGKSSLLNRLSGQETAIVTHIAGTTRDTLQSHIQLEGLPLTIIDTAGLRDSTDPVEQIGIQRAWQAINKADHLLLMIDSHEINDIPLSQLLSEFPERFPTNLPTTIIYNKADLSGKTIGIELVDCYTTLTISAKENLGIDGLKTYLKQQLGYQGFNEGQFSARRRHIDALQQATEQLNNATEQLEHKAGELVAEELRLAQQTLNSITGEFTADDLLGRIFSSFCIGK